MIYNSGTPGDGVWHCPFSPEWVAKMKRAAKHCESLSESYIGMMISKAPLFYYLPPGDFLSEPQDARGLPLSLCKKEDKRFKDWPKCCTSIYDYNSIPDIVATNGIYDWPFDTHVQVLQA